MRYNAETFYLCLKDFVHFCLRFHKIFYLFIFNLAILERLQGVKFTLTYFSLPNTDSFPFIKICDMHLSIMSKKAKH